MNIIIKYKTDQYHLVRVDMSKQVDEFNVAKAICMEYFQYVGTYWNPLECRSLCGVEYVKVGLECASMYPNNVTDGYSIRTPQIDAKSMASSNPSTPLPARSYVQQQY
jgi:hypothetical protein